MADCRATVEAREGGALIVRNALSLGPYPARLGDCLDKWAEQRPDAVWLAARDEHGDWQTLNFAEGRRRVRRLASALLGRGLSPDRPLAILSGNGINHALLAVAAMYCGIPYAPVSPAYSLISSDFGRLRSIFELLTPGLVFAAEGTAFAKAIDEVVPSDLEIIVERGAPAINGSAMFDVFEVSGRADDPAVDTARDQVGPDTVAKFLFTSGSTGTPKAVINTQRMLCANCEQLTHHFAYLRDEPPIMLEWVPWHHTAGGNHNFNLVLYNGGSFYIDEGKPTPLGIAATLRNLMDVSPNWYFNVPKGYDALVPFLRQDAALRESFFRNARLLWYAGAGMARHLWEALDELAIATTGERVTILTGLGATETAPFALGANQTMSAAGLVGLPAVGLELKLVPVGDKLEARVRGPNVTPGYWRRPDLTQAAFDEEGFYRLGDALRFGDATDVNRGFYFDGRIAEDFKLSTGIWVAVGPLRAALIDHCAPFIQDVVIAGADRNAIGALILPDVAACQRVATGPLEGLAATAADAGVTAHFTALLASFARRSTGSSNHIARAVLLAESPSIDSGEMTDKGTLNQSAVLRNRAELVDALFATPAEARVICADY